MEFCKGMAEIPQGDFVCHFAAFITYSYHFAQPFYDATNK